MTQLFGDIFFLWERFSLVLASRRLKGFRNLSGDAFPVDLVTFWPARRVDLMVEGTLSSTPKSSQVNCLNGIKDMRFRTRDASGLSFGVLAGPFGGRHSDRRRASPAQLICLGRSKRVEEVFSTKAKALGLWLLRVFQIKAAKPDEKPFGFHPKQPGDLDV